MKLLKTVVVVAIALVIGGCTALHRSDSPMAPGVGDVDRSTASRAYTDESRTYGYDLRDAQL